MHLSASSFCGLLLFFNLQQFSTQPIRTGLTGPTGLTGTDIDILRTILDRLEESASRQSELDQRGISTDRDEVQSMEMKEEAEEAAAAAAAAAADSRPSPSGLDAAEIRKFFSARNLKNVRNDPARKSSGCFGLRMDRVGWNPLGCPTIGKYMKMNSDRNP
ncbi:natriuretic peptides B [Nelusetta ayraudi]|uniref:natriuretic peptides B n=1 Tax=Nelusetta ayraudi TaxID=303726 RepID=UPI003F6FE4DF